MKVRIIASLVGAVLTVSAVGVLVGLRGADASSTAMSPRVAALADGARVPQDQWASVRSGREFVSGSAELRSGDRLDVEVVRSTDSLGVSMTTLTVTRLTPAKEADEPAMPVASFGPVEIDSADFSFSPSTLDASVSAKTDFGALDATFNANRKHDAGDGRDQLYAGESMGDGVLKGSLGSESLSGTSYHALIVDNGRADEGERDAP